METEQERRKIKRRFLSMYLQVFDASNGDLVGFLANISSTGVMVLSKAPITVHKNYVLEIRLSDVEAAMFYNYFKEKRIRFHAQSRWCSKKVNPPLISTGFMLVDVSQQDLKSINELIQKLDDRYHEILDNKT
ncbi:PilZ domain-containing protein [Candidatus Albibeggiatoa sp. nov. BB20]|uniref:PilZ domain-containing protein n=1 Tax=Candidatus Albibeggiatoa sp. nov. BB20 TaxID=3162723 RepID=UPI00336572F2